MRRLATSLLLTVTGCGQILDVGDFTSSANDPRDATVADAAPLDATRSEPSLPDAMFADARAPDAGSPDASLLDAGPLPPSYLESCGRFPYVGETCGNCIETSCCEQAAACTRDPVCAATQACYAGCGRDAACRASCNSRVPYDVPAERALESCLAVKCEATCGEQCGGSLPLERGARFRSRRECCDAEKALWNNAAAYNWQLCQDTCFWPQADRVPGPNECGCVASNPGAEGPAAILAQCAAEVHDQAPADWSCVGNVQWPRTPDPELNLRMKVLALVGGASVADVTLTACAGYESTCPGKLSTAVVTDADGQAFVRVPQRLPSSLDFYTYLQFTGPGIPDTLYYFYAPAPIRQSRSDARSVLLRETVSQIYGAAKVVPDSSRGSIGVQAWDCNPKPAAGIRVEASPSAKIIYSNGDTPDPSATMTGVNGQALLLNVEPGPVRLTFTLDATNERIAEHPVYVRPGAMTIVVTSPMP